jgi:hypothetical protein
MICDLRFVDNPRHMLECQLAQAAIVTGKEVGYRFRIEEEVPAEINENMVVLVGVRLFCGEVLRKEEISLTLIGDPRRSPVTLIGCLIAEIQPLTQRRTSENPRLPIPLYRQMLISSMAYNHNETWIVENESSNFVWMIELPTLLTQEELLMQGTCIFCQVTDQL